MIDDIFLYEHRSKYRAGKLIPGISKRLVVLKKNRYRRILKSFGRGETVKEKILNNTQTRVFNYIKDFGSITTLQACNDLGETRLSARIFELKDKGIPIGFEWIEVKNRYKETRRVKKYFFEERR